MFDHVARRYDLVNMVMTGGQVRRWRKATTVAIAPRRGERILDLAAGTGTSSTPLVAAGARVVACDRSRGMVEVGRRQCPGLQFVEGDALDLPFDDASFDTVTISYGLRNIENPLAALQEMRRVVRDGGRIVVAEFSTPTWGLLRGLYRHYLPRAIPLVGRLVSSNPLAYQYLAESVADWPDQQALDHVLATAGWADVGHRNLTAGIVALHFAWNGHRPR
ncbi:bifunctional demethylmenaquinone methyltransferase/2-methoxy-6-polyprenyl-1,4-benzoquinol methylase [Humibacillus sp. DSM 29435]|nr:bifunctional demethylmenaquinone methyltransferase/2-methoxy-6-polyprenyl-1,4-benzoquinol methylase [Humibacillus sp. DSM 29435]